MEGLVDANDAKKLDKCFQDSGLGKMKIDSPIGTIEMLKSLVHSPLKDRFEVAFEFQSKNLNTAIQNTIKNCDEFKGMNWGQKYDWATFSPINQDDETLDKLFASDKAKAFEQNIYNANAAEAAPIFSQLRQSLTAHVNARNFNQAGRDVANMIKKINQIGLKKSPSKLQELQQYVLYL